MSDTNTIQVKERLKQELQEYLDKKSTPKDYFQSSKEISAWLKEKEK